MVIQNSHIRRGSKGDSTLFFFSLICIEQTPNTIDALYPPILVKKKYYYKLSSPPASMRLISISQAITKWRNFTSSNLLKDWEVLAKHHSNLYSKDSTSISEQIKETPPNVEKTSSSYVCQLQVLFVYPCSILFPPQSSMHLPKFFSAAS